ncbi:MULTISPECIES: hypothetical protein [Bacillus cereus group]|uniref:Uncharacterized protein n=1 Tax=Bacillus cereus TaxID=1396 RepID=A0A9X7B7D5_BACCE|nr:MULTISPECIES: hypothetical protein [Bacillus cereus group]PFV02919.1 hypothetical protein COK98_25645 [Bacillus cereus]PGK66289.1 hypothetical protein CN928_25720 [Bacillus thuringiensis]
MALPIPLTTLPIPDEYEDYLLTSPQGSSVYVVDYLFRLDGRSNIYVSSVVREDMNLRVRFVNLTGEPVRVDVYMMQATELLARYHQCRNPIYTTNLRTVTLKGGANPPIIIPSDNTSDNIYMLGYSLRILSGSDQIRVNGFYMDSVDDKIILELYNPIDINTEVEVGIVMVNPEVDRTSRTFPHQCKPRLLRGESKPIIFDESSIVQEVSLKPLHSDGAIVSFTVEPQFNTPNGIYVSERYYDGNILKLKLINPERLSGTINVIAWETIPSQGVTDLADC